MHWNKQRGHNTTDCKIVKTCQIGCNQRHQNWTWKCFLSIGGQVHSKVTALVALHCMNAWAIWALAGQRWRSPSIGCPHTSAIGTEGLQWPCRTPLVQCFGLPPTQLAARLECHSNANCGGQIWGSERRSNPLVLGPVNMGVAPKLWFGTGGDERGCGMQCRSLHCRGEAVDCGHAQNLGPTFQGTFCRPAP